MSPRYQPSDIRRVAIEFDVHERTVMKALAGLEVRGRAGQRAARAVAALLAPSSSSSGQVAA